jgi:hypothetical protein
VLNENRTVLTQDALDCIQLLRRCDLLTVSGPLISLGPSTRFENVSPTQTSAAGPSDLLTLGPAQNRKSGKAPGALTSVDTLTSRHWSAAAARAASASPA